MRKLQLFTICFLSYTSLVIAQSDKAILDSLKKHDMLIQMLDSLDKPTSYFKAGAGFGMPLLHLLNAF